MFLAQTLAPGPLQLLLALLPWTLVFAFIIIAALTVWTAIRKRPDKKEVDAHLDRMRQHMTAVEEKLDTLIEIVRRQSGG